MVGCGGRTFCAAHELTVFLSCDGDHNFHRPCGIFSAVKKWSANPNRRRAKRNRRRKLARRAALFLESRRNKRRSTDATAVAAVKRRLRSGQRRRQRRPRTARKAGLPDTVKAPAHLSLFDNTEETIRYCEDVGRRASKPNAEVYLDFSEVGRFTTDALLLVRAIMDNHDKKGVVRHPAVFRGNLPTNQQVAAEFKATGFFEGFAKPPKNLPEPKGFMLQESKDVVHARVAADLSRFAVKNVKISPRSVIASSRNLVELMTNTHEHAKRRRINGKDKAPQPSTMWFASVYCREGVAYFNFLDLGMGIMGSAPVKDLKLRMMRFLGSDISNPELLTKVFNGEAGSSTRKPWRGQGLPRMKRDAEAGRLVSLSVLTSDVIGTVEGLDFRPIGEGFRGTAFRWQVRQEGGGV